MAAQTFISGSPARALTFDWVRKNLDESARGSKIRPPSRTPVMRPLPPDRRSGADSPVKSPHGPAEMDQAQAVEFRMRITSALTVAVLASTRSGPGAS